MKTKIFLEWVKGELKNSGLKQRDLANVLELNETQTGRLLKAERELKFGEAIKIIEFLGKQPPKEILVAAQVSTVKFVPLVGTLAAGVWREQGDMHPHEDTRIPFVGTEEFSDLPQHAYLIQDEHAEAHAHKGFYLICVDYEAARGTEFRNNDIVVVKQTGKSHGRMKVRIITEYTAKELINQNGQLYLKPLSITSNDNDLVPYNPISSDYKIIGLVIAEMRFTNSRK